MLICIDPGHGGYDPGALGKNGTRESEVALKVALVLKVEFEALGLGVVLTRDTDKYVSLTERAMIANKAKADYFISIHLNSAVNPTAKGSEAWIYPGAMPDRVLANALLANVCSSIHTVPRGVKEEEFTVLKATNMPAVLLELLFISNPAEEEMASSLGWVNTVVEALVDGFIDFLGIARPNDVPASAPTPAAAPVPVEHWGVSYIKRLKEVGLIKDIKVPEDKVSWAELAVVVCRVLDKIKG